MHQLTSVNQSFPLIKVHGVLNWKNIDCSRLHNQTTVQLLLTETLLKLILKGYVIICTFKGI